MFLLETRNNGLHVANQNIKLNLMGSPKFHHPAGNMEYNTQEDYNHINNVSYYCNSINT